MAEHNAQSQHDVRRFIRIPSILPVDFQLLCAADDTADPEVRTGFTDDLSEGGLCLRVTHVPASLTQLLESHSSDLKITIDLRLKNRRLRIPSRVAWTRRLEILDEYLLGVEFLCISSADAQAVAEFARRAAIRPKILRLSLVALAIALVSSLGLFAHSGWQHRSELAASNQALSKSVAEATEMSTELERSWVDMRWLATELADVGNDLGRNLEEQTPAIGDKVRIRATRDRLSSELESMRPAVADLQRNIKVLRALMTEWGQLRATEQGSASRAE